MRGYKSSFAKDLHQGPGINNLDLHPNKGVGYAVVMFVNTKLNMIVLGYLMFPVVFDLEVFNRQGKQSMLLISQELLFPALILSLHSSLVMQLYFLLDGLI